MKLRGLSALAASLAVCCFTLTIRDSHADVDQAKALFNRAQIRYNVGDFERALTLYTAAYKEKPLAGFLFNIAQCHRMVGRYQRALFFYERYLGLLDSKPSAHRREVEGFVKACKEKIAARAKSDGLALKKSTQKESTLKKTADPLSAPKKRSAAILWIGAGSSAALAILGAVTGAMAQSKNDEYRDPATSPARAAELKDAGRPLGITSVIAFSAAGALAASTLIYYVFSYKNPPERAEVTATPLSGGAAAQLRFSF